MTHVVFIVPSLGLGGAERSLLRTIAALQPAVERIGLIVLADVTPTMAAELPKGTELHVLNCSTSASPWAWARIRRILKACKPDVVVGWSTYANFVAIVSTRGMEIPVVVSERNYVPKIVAGVGVGRIRRQLVVRLMKLLYRKADVITANSADGLRFLKKFIGTGPRYAQLPNTLNMEEVEVCAGAQPEVLPRDTAGPHLLAMGRLQPQKGFDLLLEALALVRKSYGWHLVLVGDGPEKERLRALARQLGIEDAIQWIGPVANPFPYYRWADLVVVPSRFEGFPNVALEAMSCARTVICSDCRTGPRELTQHGNFGVLVPSNNATLLARAIADWGHNPERRNRMGAMASEHIRTLYDIGHTRDVFVGAFSLVS